MKRIKLTKGEYALVDNEDYERLSQYKWYLHKYAIRTKCKNGREENINMHWDIIGKPKNKLVTDHINGNKIDNRKSNLRFVNATINSLNRGKNKRNKSGYKGVSWVKIMRKWKAQINYGKKTILLGYFDKPEEAAKAYIKKLKDIFKSNNTQFKVQFPTHPPLYLVN